MTRKQLRMAIAAADLSLDTLAEESGVNKATISRIQKGHVAARADTLQKLKSALVARGIQFSAHNGTVCVCAPNDE
jgi:transcriptional regulator with XRE-family HTH domain